LGVRKSIREGEAAKVHQQFWGNEGHPKRLTYGGSSSSFSVLSNTQNVFLTEVSVPPLVGGYFGIGAAAFDPAGAKPVIEAKSAMSARKVACGEQQDFSTQTVQCVFIFLPMHLPTWGTWLNLIITTLPA
jgi:hypothetical protein